MPLVTIAFGLMMGILVVRTVGMAVFEARTSMAEGKPRQAKLRMAFAVAIAVGCSISVIGILINDWPVRALGIGVFATSVPILIGQIVHARAKSRANSVSGLGGPTCTISDWRIHGSRC
jgi:hypothetical protein